MEFQPETVEERAARLARIAALVDGEVPRELTPEELVACLPPRGPMHHKQNQERKRVRKLFSRCGWTMNGRRIPGEPKSTYADQPYAKNLGQGACRGRSGPRQK